MFGFKRQRTDPVAVTLPEPPQQVAPPPKRPLTERELLLRQQYERLANHHAMAEAENHACKCQRGLH